MYPKKSRGKVYGAVLTAAEQKAMDIEIRRQLAEYTRKHLLESCAIVLWVLHEKQGYELEKLREFYDDYVSALDELADRYEMENWDNAWLCMQKLKAYGIDIEEWDREKEKENG